MSLLVGEGCFPGIIDEITIAKILTNDTPVTLSVWQKIKEFFCQTNQTEAMTCLHRLCHPEPDTTKNDTKALFYKLSELAYPGVEDCFSVNENNGILSLRITDAIGNNLLTIRLETDYIVEWKNALRYDYPLRQW